MPIIKVSNEIVTQVNVFTAPDGEQLPLIAYLTDAARAAREVDGWLSASLHRSLDGTRVINYAQSANRDASMRVFDHLWAKGLIEGNKQFGEAHPGLYEVVYTLEK
ncbi:antibiotic biosynthesis monooxygenase [Mesorhizobium australicum]|uniref:antibiotic biosynthesis monooxygenase n=1 Tax=Mesorhizobium australicum TaxID=536018 RepID=UPI00333D74E6